MSEQENLLMRGYEWSMVCGSCNDIINIRGMGHGLGQDTMTEGRTYELQSGDSVTCPHCNTTHVVSISVGVNNE